MEKKFCTAFLVKDKDGATLAEVIVSVLLISIIVIGSLNLFVQNISSGNTITYIYTATNLAKNRIERLRAVDFAILTSAIETDTILNQDGVSDPDGEYRRITSVTTPYNGDGKLAYIDVQVFYTVRGTENSVPARITTILSNY